MDLLNEVVRHIELHSAEGIKDCFSNGVSPNDTFNGEPLIYELTSEYLRGTRFKECVKVFVEFGLEFKDKSLLAVLLDDSKSLQNNLTENPKIVNKKYSLKCAYTQLYEVTLLHICAEFNHLDCAKILVNGGADVNEKAGIDENGFGGQTPIFHTVNQNMNQSVEMMDFLLSKDADMDLPLWHLFGGWVMIGKL